MKRYLFLLLSFFALSLYAQQGSLTGTAIAASDKEPMIGLTVLVKGTTNGTVTDLDGNYTLTNVPKDATIVFSMIGYKTQEVKVNGKNVINVVMEDDTQALDEVVVIGYGAVKKSDLTSSISAIKGDELKKLTGGNAMNALQGKINGVQIPVVAVRVLHLVLLFGGYLPSMVLIRCMSLMECRWEPISIFLTRTILNPCKC